MMKIRFDLEIEVENEAPPAYGHDTWGETVAEIVQSEINGVRSVKIQELGRQIEP